MQRTQIAAGALLMLMIIAVAGPGIVVWQQSASAQPAPPAPPPSEEQQIADLIATYRTQKAAGDAKRTQTLSSLYTHRGEVTARFFLEVYRDTTEDVSTRRYAFSLLTAVPDPSVRDDLMKMYRQPADDYEKSCALRGLGKLRALPAAEFVTIARTTDDLSLLGAALDGWQAAGVADFDRQLGTLFKGRSEAAVGVRVTILCTWLRNHGRAAIAAIPALMAAEGITQYQISSMFMAISAEDVRRPDVPVLLGVLAGKQPTAADRVQLIKVLRAISDPEIVSVLIRGAATHASDDVRAIATDATQKIAANKDVLQKSRDRVAILTAIDTLGSFGPAGVDTVRAELRELLKSRDAGLLAAALDALGRGSPFPDDDKLVRELTKIVRTARRDPGPAGLALIALAGSVSDDDFLDAVGRFHNPPWFAQLMVVDALVRHRQKVCVDQLIAMLEEADKLPLRVRGAVGDALVNLTGRDFPPDHTLWSTWWRANRERNELRDPDAPFADAGAAQTGSFYGIKLDSNRVCFILDISGSMEAAMQHAPEGIDVKSPSYLEGARFEIARSMQALKDGGTDARFNVILAHPQKPKRWRDKLQEANSRNFADAKEFMKETNNAGDNLYDALMLAFEDPEIDTVFILSDGVATVGAHTYTDPPAFLAAVRSENRLRRVTIHTIGTNNPTGNAIMAPLARQNHGVHTNN